MRQSGTLINAALVLVFTGVVVIFVVRPLMRVLSGPAAARRRTTTCRRSA